MLPKTIYARTLGKTVANLPQGPYLTPERTSKLDLLDHLLINGRKPILLRGPTGSGKSYFLEQFVARLGGDGLVAHLGAQDDFASREELLRLLASRFSGLDKSLIGEFSALFARGERFVLIVEDVDERAPESVAVLISLAEEFKCIFLLLSTNENLIDLEKQCQVIDLEAFTQKQTIEYARLLIQSEFGRQEVAPGFDELVLFIETGGLPGRIHDVIAKLVSSEGGAPTQKHGKSASGRAVSLLYAIPLAAGVMAVIIYAGVFNNGTDTAQNVGGQQLSPKPPEKLRLANSQSVGQKPEGKPAAMPQRQAKSVVQQTEPVGEGAVLVGPDWPQTAAGVLQDEQRAVKNVPPQASTKPKPDVIIVADKSESTAAVAEQVATLTRPDNSSNAQLEGERAAIPQAHEESVESGLKKASEKAPLPPAGRLESDRTWIQSMPGEQYTLQIMGLGKQSAADAYLARFPDITSLHMYRSKRNNGAWYAILYGAYPDRTAAVQALSSVRRQFPGVEPWPRRFSAIKEDLY